MAYWRYLNHEPISGAIPSGKIIGCIIRGVLWINLRDYLGDHTKLEGEFLEVSNNHMNQFKKLFHGPKLEMAYLTCLFVS